MNYLWQLLLYMQEQKIQLKDLRFVPAKSYSPYMELSQTDINNIDVHQLDVIEINPYYRFYTIFKDMFLPDIKEYKELRESLFHLILYMLAENDLKQGMNKKEYYKKFLYTDLKSGTFGKQIKESIELFTLRERNILLGGLIKQYACKDSLQLLQDIITAIFKNTIIYHNSSCSDEILIYIGLKQTKELEQKVDTVLNLFSNIRYNIELYYQYHFAVLGIDETCSIEEISLY